MAIFIAADTKPIRRLCRRKSFNYYRAGGTYVIEKMLTNHFIIVIIEAINERSYAVNQTIIIFRIFFRSPDALVCGTRRSMSE